jgi:hypothetical protein
MFTCNVILERRLEHERIARLAQRRVQTCPSIRVTTEEITSPPSAPRSYLRRTAPAPAAREARGDRPTKL